MPEKHKQYAQWNAERFIAWAERVGPNTTTVIRAILSGHLSSLLTDTRLLG